MRKRLLLFVSLAVCFCFSAIAQSNAKSDAQKSIGSQPSVRMIMPVFSELVMFSYPEGFHGVNEQANTNSYLFEMVPSGQTVDKWTQMVTVTGAKGLAANPKVTAESVLVQIALGFKRDCPETFSIEIPGATKIGSHDAFVAWASCGIADAGASYSESALLLSIKGSHDSYTIQWAERGPASSKPILYDAAKWEGRLKKLNPIKICPRLSGEQEPYPSCVNQK